MDPWVVKVLINAASEGLCAGDDQAAVRELRAQLGRAMVAARANPFAERLIKAITEAERALDDHLELGDQIRRRREGEPGIAFIGHMVPCSVCGWDILASVDSDPATARCANTAECEARKRGSQ